MTPKHLNTKVVSWGEARKYGFQNIFFVFMKKINTFMDKKHVFTLGVFNDKVMMVK